MGTADKGLEECIKPLGFKNRRGFTLRMLSKQWDAGRPAHECYGVGQYGKDCLEVFVYKNYAVQPKDEALKLYIKWARRQYWLYKP
jgi:hypothetical protein